MAGEMTSTEVLIAAARSGDAAACSRLLVRFDAFLRSSVLKYLGRTRFRIDGEDILQTIRLSISRSISRLRACDRASFLAWLTSLIESRLHDSGRRRKRENQGPDGSALRLDRTGAVDVPAKSQTPSILFLRKESRERLGRAIERVDERYRPLLRYLSKQDPEPSEVAAFLGKTSDAARKFVSRALDHLERALKAEGESRQT